ncbi:MAG TPA: helix-turn-helix domain-containing protein [Longimicrobium sp.]|nr:helix-turn-helix domain-containing protein [Longimicrobium sp.]
MADSEKTPGESGVPDAPGGAARHLRADAKRNIDTLLEAAKEVFATSGVDAPVREVAARAGVGVGTVYRHFPQRADLVAAVFRREVDACAAAAPALAAEHPPCEALSAWLRRYTRFIATKRGLAAALHAGDPAFEPLPAYFQQHLGPALESLLDAAAAAGAVRSDVDPNDLLRAVGNLCLAGSEAGACHSERMVDLLIDGLRYGARPPAAADSPPERNDARG